MTDREKVKEIKLHYTNGNFFSSVRPSDLEDALVEMAQWKDEEHDKELLQCKKDIIEKAVLWLKANMVGKDMGKYPMYSPDFTEFFKKAMER